MNLSITNCRKETIFESPTRSIHDWSQSFWFRIHHFQSNRAQISKRIWQRRVIIENLILHATLRDEKSNITLTGFDFRAWWSNIFGQPSHFRTIDICGLSNLCVEADKNLKTRSIRTKTILRIEFGKWQILDVRDDLWSQTAQFWKNESEKGTDLY